MEPNHSIHHQDPEINALVHKAVSSLPQLQKALEADHVLGNEGGLSAGHQEALFQIVEQLCEEGNFLHAAPLALHLAVHHPRDSRYAFAAGCAFQRLAIFNVAAVFYALCRQQQKTPTVMYRLGECAAGMGYSEAAVRIFDAAFDLARGDDQCRHLQDLAMQAIERLRSTTQRT